jgi:hypothetical protein
MARLPTVAGTPTVYRVISAVLVPLPVVAGCSWGTVRAPVIRPSTGYPNAHCRLLCPLNRIVQGTLPEQYKLACDRYNRMQIGYADRCAAAAAHRFQVHSDIDYRRSTAQTWLPGTVVYHRLIALLE